MDYIRALGQQESPFCPYNDMILGFCCLCEVELLKFVTRPARISDCLLACVLLTGSCLSMECCHSMQINNGTYKSGFATTQGAYDKAQSELYDGLDHIEQRLAKSRFLLGDRCRLHPSCICHTSLDCSSRQGPAGGTLVCEHSAEGTPSC